MGVKLEGVRSLGCVRLIFVILLCLGVGDCVRLGKSDQQGSICAQPHANFVNL
jgi:hypothetical protein